MISTLFRKIKKAKNISVLPIHITFIYIYTESVNGLIENERKRTKKEMLVKNKL